MNNKLYYFFVPLLLVLAAVVAINVYFDPANLWHESNLVLDSNFSPEECLKMPPDGNERLLKRIHLRASQAPELLILGSSRSMTVTQDMFNNKIVFNAGMSNAGLEDYFSLWQMNKTFHKVPKILLILADPWIFSSTVNSGEWVENAEYYLQYIKENKEPNNGPLATFKINIAIYQKKMERYFFKISDLLSHAVLKRSLREFFGKEAIRAPIGILKFANPDTIHNGWCWRSDSSLLYNAEKLQKMDLSKYLKTLQENSKDHAGFDTWNFDPRNIIRFRNFVERVQNAGTKVFIISPPYQQDVLAEYQKSDAYKKIINEYHESILAAHADYTCEALDPKKIPCDRDEFMDTLHMLPSCVRKLINHCNTNHAF